MTTIRLLDLYSKALDELQASLGEAAPADELANALATLTPRLPDGRPDPRAAAYADAVKSALSLTLYAVRDARAPRVGPASGHATSARDVKSPGHATSAAPGPVKGLATALRIWLAPGKAAPAPVPARVPPSGPVLVTVAKVLDGFRAALEEADQAAAAAAPPSRSPERMPWSEDDELIDMLHDVLAARVRGREGFALARIEDLAETLAARGIQAVSYDPEDTGFAGDARCFDFVEGARPGAPGMTLMPVLIDDTEDDRILRRGRVRPAPGPRPTAGDADAPPRNEATH
ncbi:hypothetical protein [Streptomyces olivochromogenes]|uniref:hypothetical protein n=1 Tax=Streptomyces olivochromogenes TaxID=1963 RepID=UPI001F1D9D20|nr:hypothetical protein [Streptomyces olivochromogenes]MCF3130391.1 hypothetical protein [Streptomyces olivochromogenes]